MHLHATVNEDIKMKTSRVLLYLYAGRQQPEGIWGQFPPIFFYSQILSFPEKFF